MAGVIGAWIEGEAPSVQGVRQELKRERPLVGAQMLPAAILLAGALRLISGRAAITVALGTALAELMVCVVLACRRVGASWLQATISISVGAFFAAMVVLLKVFVHG